MDKSDRTEDKLNEMFAPATTKADYSLLKRVRDGDCSAFEKLYLRYYKSVYGFISHVLHSSADVEDIIQDTFARLWSMRESINPELSVKSLIFKMVRCAVIDLWRHTERTTVIFADKEPEDNNMSGNVSPEDILDAHETKLLLDIAIAHMPPRQREIFLLHVNENLSPAEIASRLDLSYDNVRKQIYNGKRDLREMLLN